MKVLISCLLLFVTLSSVSAGLYMRNPVNLDQNNGHGREIISIDPGLTLNDVMKSIHVNNPLPPSVTIFFPTEENTTFISEKWSSDPWLIPYHILPHAFSSCELKRYFMKGAQIPTLLLGKFITVTSNSVRNFTINGYPISHPDMYKTPAMVVHGIPTIFNFTRNGGNNTPLRPRISSQTQSWNNALGVDSAQPQQPENVNLVTSQVP